MDFGKMQYIKVKTKLKSLKIRTKMGCRKDVAYVLILLINVLRHLMNVLRQLINVSRQKRNHE